MIETAALAPGCRVPRIIVGGWQTAGHSDAAIPRLMAFADAGLTAFESADIYPGHAALLGRLGAAWRAGGGDRPALRFHTRYTPDLGHGAPTRRTVTAAVDRALADLGATRLDLVQLQWWRLEIAGRRDVLGWLAALADQGKIDRIGVTNFPTRHLAEALDAGLPVVSNQVQYSLIDRRAERHLVPLCGLRGVALLAYGPMAGGFLSDAWRGRPDPGPANGFSREYRFMIDRFGGWAAYQELLGVLKRIADRHQVSIANVAQRWLLDRPAVAAILVGASRAGRVRETLRTFALPLDDQDCAAIAAVGGIEPQDDIGELERDRDGPFHRILRESLAAKAGEPGG